MKLSVLMSIYHKEKPRYFDKCMQSIWYDQTIKPDEIVLVQDGKLTDELYEIIEIWKGKLQDTLKIIPLEINIGTGGAKKIGIENCSYNYIAVMDTDDISASMRFEKQLKFLEKNKDIDVVGTFISEIDENEIVTRNIVRYPLTHSELYRFFEKRDPIPHVTTMFRRSYFNKAGNYRSDLHLAEDTLLWYQAFLNNCKLANIDYVGVQVRQVSELYRRRANIKKSVGLLKYRIFKINRDLKYGTKADIYAIAYFLISISPSFIKKIVYNKLR